MVFSVISSTCYGGLASLWRDGDEMNIDTSGGKLTSDGLYLNLKICVLSMTCVMTAQYTRFESCVHVIRYGVDN